MRIQVVISIAIAFALSAGLSYFNEERTVRESVDNQYRVRLTQAQESLEQRRSLRDFAVLARAESLGRSERIAEQLLRLKQLEAQAVPGAENTEADKPDAEAVLVSVHHKLEQEIAAVMAYYASMENVQDKSSLANSIEGAPGLVSVVHSDGRVLAEKGTYKDAWDRIDKRLIPVISNPKNKSAQDSRLDVWFQGETPLIVGIAPIVVNGETIGGVVVGHSLNNEPNRDKKALQGLDVAYRISASDIDGTKRQFVRTTVSRDAGRQVESFFTESANFRGGAAGYRSLAVPGQSSGVHLFFVRQTGFLSAEVAIGVFGSASKNVKDASSSLGIIFIMGVLGILLASGLALMFIGRYLKPIEQLDQGILELLEGNLDYWFATEGNQETSRLAQNLNILVCQLSGRPLPPEEDSVAAGDWVNDQLFVEALEADELDAMKAEFRGADQQTGTVSLAMLRVLNDADDVYARRTFSDYVEALERTDQPRGGLTFQLFDTELKRKTAMLTQDLGCDRLRFIVEIEKGRASLRPVPLT